MTPLSGPTPMMKKKSRADEIMGKLPPRFEVEWADEAIDALRDFDELVQVMEAEITGLQAHVKDILALKQQVHAQLEVSQRLLAEAVGALGYCVETMQVERNEYDEWVSRRPGGRYREAAANGSAVLARIKAAKEQI